MVFGLFENNGSLDLRVDGASFAPGQKITGTVVLKLAKTMQARGLRMAFYGTVPHSRHSVRRILQVTQLLSGEKPYSPGEAYTFELPVPQPIEYQLPEGGAWDLVAGMAVQPRPRGWYVQATLDIPKAADLNSVVQIAVVGEMIKLARIKAGTDQERYALTLHNADMDRALYGGAPPPQPGAQPPSKPV